MSDPRPARRLLAGNWKMNLDHAGGLAHARACLGALDGIDVPVVLCTPAIHLHAVGQLVDGEPDRYVGAQDVSEHPPGAHTGDLAATQLRSCGCAYVIVGHSERRQDHAESGDLLARKLQAALAAELRPIYCFGETLEEREAGREAEVVARQLEEGLAGFSGKELSRIALAYEPVWAIGTGRTASAEQAQAIHRQVREWVADRFDASRANALTILYGGSVKPGNAADLFSRPDIDGGLIGGASLAADDFAAIARALAGA